MCFLGFLDFHFFYHDAVKLFSAIENSPRKKSKPTHSYQTLPHQCTLCGFYPTLPTWSLNRNHNV